MTTGGMVPLPDPALLIAAVSAVLQGIRAWIAVRDRKRTADVVDSAVEKASRSAAVRKEAEALVTLLPPDVLATLVERVNSCWEHYHDVLRSDEEFLPGQVDKATSAVKRCICRELQRIYDLNGAIPPGVLSDWWEAYCAA